jgi:hypothetical protein
MKDIQKIKEFFSQPVKESLTGGYPHTKTSGENFEKITITEPIDDATKDKMIKNFRAAGWDAKPNNGGGITAIKKAMMEAKEETAIDMAKKQLDALGIKYEMSGNKFKPFKVIYKPYNEDLDALYDQEYELTRIYQQDKGKENWEKLSQIREKGKRLEEFEDIIDLFNLGSAVKSSMGEAKFQSGMLSGKDFINAKLQNYPKAVAKVNQLINMIGEDKFTIEMAEWIFDFFNNAHFESPMNELRLENVAPNHDGKSSPYGSGYKPLEERISEALDQINEELCPAGKAYRKRRMAAGEKSSAYLSGRAVKVCKGQMSGKKKKK